MSRQHQIPTHLNVEDHAFFGLSVRQFMDVSAGLAGSYGMWNHWPDAPTVVRAGVAGLTLLVALATALVRPGGRRLEAWLACWLRFLLIARTATWRPVVRSD